MIHHILNAIGGIQGFGVISVCLFFAVFVGTLVWAFCQKKTFLNSMEAMPLRDEESAADEKGNNLHE